MYMTRTMYVCVSLVNEGCKERQILFSTNWLYDDYIVSELKISYLTFSPIPPTSLVAIFYIFIFLYNILSISVNGCLRFISANKGNNRPTRKVFKPQKMHKKNLPKNDCIWDVASAHSFDITSCARAALLTFRFPIRRYLRCFCHIFCKIMCIIIIEHGRRALASSCASVWLVMLYPFQLLLLSTSLTLC